MYWSSLQMMKFLYMSSATATLLIERATSILASRADQDALTAMRALHLLVIPSILGHHCSALRSRNQRNTDKLAVCLFTAFDRKRRFSCWRHQLTRIQRVSTAAGTFISHPASRCHQGHIRGNAIIPWRKGPRGCVCSLTAGTRDGST